MKDGFVMNERHALRLKYVCMCVCMDVRFVLANKSMGIMRCSGGEEMQDTNESVCLYKMQFDKYVCVCVCKYKIYNSYVGTYVWV